LITTTFKNVNQGDSIILEWSTNEKQCIGIIDCNIKDKENPILNYLKEKKPTELEFIILSHFHFDHYSGLAEIFEFCVQQKIKIKKFYHTIFVLLYENYNRILISKKVERETQRFFESYDLVDHLIEDSIEISHHLAPLNLTNKINLSFLAPSGNTYKDLIKQLARKNNKIVKTAVDMNKLSTIIKIENELECILLTSDAVKDSFKKIKKNNLINKKITLVQVPHHGSWHNIYEPFWNDLIKEKNCPAIFSVGYEPKDKLPNEQTVEFFSNNNFSIYSTNSVFGIESYFKIPNNTSIISNKSILLNSFSSLKRRSNLNLNNNLSNLNGDHSFNSLI